MERTAREAISAISVDIGPSWTAERHVMQRVEYVVNQVAQTHRGQEEEAVAREITARLRALGVQPLGRRVRHYAEAISRLPELPPPPRAA